MLDDEIMRKQGIASLMHAPIELGPRLYGVLSVGHEDPVASPRRTSSCWRGSRAPAPLRSPTRRTSSASGASRAPSRWASCRSRCRSCPGYETGLLYAPALGEPTGGDVYGAWRLPGGDFAVLVGDVAGKGVETAALSAMVRFFVEARSWDEPSPALVLEQANSMMMGRLSSDAFVTAFLCVLSPGRLRYCNAGHLPPLHLSGAGVRTPRGPRAAAGHEAGTRYGDEELRLDEGDLVFAYTDGLTEARRGGETFGQERLAQLVLAWAKGRSPDELVRAVHERDRRLGRRPRRRRGRPGAAAARLTRRPPASLEWAA